MTLNQIHGSLGSLNFVSLSSSYKLSFFLLDFYSLEKNPSLKLFWRALILAQQHQFSEEFICRPGWFTISDSESRIKFIISTPVKFAILYSIGKVSQVTFEGQIWYIHYFSKAVVSNTRVPSTFNAAIIACFDISIIIIYFL